MNTIKRVSIFTGIFLISIASILFAVDTYKNYQLPPTFDLFPKFNRYGKKTWLQSYSIRPSGQSLNAADYFPDGKHLLVGESDGKQAGKMMKVNIRNNSIVWQMQPFVANKYAGHMALRYVGVSPNGQYVYGLPYVRNGDNGYRIVVLNGNSGQVVNYFKIPSFKKECRGYKWGKRVMLHAWKAMFAKDSRHLYIYYKNQYGVNYGPCKVVDDVWLIKWNILSGRVVWKSQIRILPIPKLGVPEYACMSRFNLDVSPNGRKIAIGNCNGEILIFDSYSGRELFRIFSYIEPWRSIGKPGMYAAMNVKFHPRDNDRLFAVMSSSGSKAVIAEASVSQRKFSNHLVTAQTNDIPEIGFSPDGRIMAVGYGNLRVWDTKLKMLIAANDGFHFKINPKYQEIMLISNKDLVFIHPRKRKGYWLTSQWQNTGKYIQNDVQYVIKAKRGKFQVRIAKGQVSNRAAAYSYRKTTDIGRRHIGWLYVRAYNRSNMKVMINGGLKQPGMQQRLFRRRLKRWGSSYPSVYDYGGRVGVNSYKPSGTSIKRIVKRKKTYDWRKYKVSADNANSELGYGVDTNRPGLIIAALKAGANVHHKGTIGIPYFFYAAMTSTDMTQIFIDHGVNVNVRSSTNSTALINAAWNKKHDVMMLLIKNGAKIDLQNDDKKTALMHSAMKCDVEGFSLLVAAGANYRLRDKYGLDAYKLAARRCSYMRTTKKLKEILRKKGYYVK